MRATSLFSLRRVLLPQTLPGILLFLLLAAWGFLWVQKALNPRDLNHLLIIDRFGHELGSECEAELQGDVDWQVRIRMPYARRGDPMGSAIAVSNIERPWFGGIFRIKDGAGRLLAEHEIAPRSRYGETLVITLDPDGRSQSAFNEIPELPEQ